MKSNPASTPTFLPTREVVTEQQVAACLAVLRELQPYTLGQPQFTDVPADRPELDGGVKDSLSVALMSVLGRIERIMTDNARWDVSGTTEIFKQLVETQKAQQAFLREQAASAHLVQLPQFLLKPELMSDGTHFYAIWGNKDLPGGRIIGRGVTPTAALSDFDAAFNRAPAEQLQLILEQNPPEESE
ncbi:MAG: hypothetical protein HOO67_01520 [Candidatus Peribacteraceae bacterium]|nr:hypothetical protein [Candidatus Peribacteraceae bacterium]